MKKIISLVFIFIMSIFLVACGDDDAATGKGKKVSNEEAATFLSNLELNVETANYFETTLTTNGKIEFDLNEVYTDADEIINTQSGLDAEWDLKLSSGLNVASELNDILSVNKLEGDLTFDYKVDDLNITGAFDGMVAAYVYQSYAYVELDANLETSQAPGVTVNISAKEKLDEKIPQEAFNLGELPVVTEPLKPFGDVSAQEIQMFLEQFDNDLVSVYKNKDQYTLELKLSKTDILMFMPMGVVNTELLDGIETFSFVITVVIKNQSIVEIKLEASAKLNLDTEINESYDGITIERTIKLVGEVSVSATIKVADKTPSLPDFSTFIPKSREEFLASITGMFN